MAHRRPTIALILLIALASSGCHYLQEINAPIVTPEGRNLREDGTAGPKAMQYPRADIAGPLDIEIIRRGRGIVIDNRTARTYHDVQIWLNHEYGLTVPEITIGRNEPIHLESFVNHYAEPFPTAAFLNPERNRPVVMADLFMDDKLYKLVVRLEKDWQYK